MLDLRRSPAAVGAGLRAVHGATLALPGIRVDAEYLDGCTRHRAIGRHAAGRAGNKAAQLHTLLRRDCDARGLAAGDELVDLAEGPRVKRHFAMIEGAEHEVGGPLQLRTFDADAGWRTGLADE